MMTEKAVLLRKVNEEMMDGGGGDGALLLPPPPLPSSPPFSCPRRGSGVSGMSGEVRQKHMAYLQTQLDFIRKELKVLQGEEALWQEYQRKKAAKKGRSGAGVGDLSSTPQLMTRNKNKATAKKRKVETSTTQQSGATTTTTTSGGGADENGEDEELMLTKLEIEIEALDEDDLAALLALISTFGLVLSGEDAEIDLKQLSAEQLDQVKELVTKKLFKTSFKTSPDRQQGGGGGGFELSPEEQGGLELPTEERGGLEELPPEEQEELELPPEEEPPLPLGQSAGGTPPATAATTAGVDEAVEVSLPEPVPPPPAPAPASVGEEIDGPSAEYDEDDEFLSIMY